MTTLFLGVRIFIQNGFQSMSITSIGWTKPTLGLEADYSDDICETFNALNLNDSLISEINPIEEQVAFLLGAGASKPSPSNIPTVTDLLPELLHVGRRARRLDREQVTSLADFCNDQGIDNIEDLLTAVLISDLL